MGRIDWIQISKSRTDSAQPAVQTDHNGRELETKEGAERDAKERLNLKNPGENVVVVVEKKKEIPEVTPRAQFFWERIGRFFAALVGR